MHDEGPGRICPYCRAAERSKSRTSRGFKKVFHRANVARGAAVVSARLHPCRFHSRSQPSRHRPRRPTSRRIVRQAARYVRALLLARIYEVLVAIALMTVWSPVPCPDHPIRTVLPAAAACASPRSAVYRRRKPERTLLCRTVAHGFARARCAACGHDFLIAYSCKCRGVCPSCTTRRMVETAAHLADHVIPRRPRASSSTNTPPSWPV